MDTCILTKYIIDKGGTWDEIINRAIQLNANQLLKISKYTKLMVIVI